MTPQMTPQLNPDLDPLDCFATWLDAAKTAEPNDPTAMALATVSASGEPDIRMVLLKSYDQRGFVFYSNTKSSKGHDLAAHPKAALCFHWKSLQRQIRLRGSVVAATTAESDGYFNSRPLASRIAAWASKQSQPIPASTTLQQEFDRQQARFATTTPPRPPYWRGYRLIPNAIEFWVGDPDRLHDRLLYTRETVTDSWQTTPLYP